MSKYLTIDTTLIFIIAPYSGFYILNQPLFNLWKLSFSFQGQLFSVFSIKKLSLFSAKYVFH